MANFFSGGRKKDAPDSKPAIKVHSYELTFGRPLVVVAGEDAAGASKHRHVCQLAVGETFEEEIVFKIKGKGQSVRKKNLQFCGFISQWRFHSSAVVDTCWEEGKRAWAYTYRFGVHKNGGTLFDLPWEPCNGKLVHRRFCPCILCPVVLRTRNLWRWRSALVSWR